MARDPLTDKNWKPPPYARKPHSTVEVFSFFRGHAEVLIYKGRRRKKLQFQNKKFSNQQDFGKKWRRFSKIGFRGQESRGSWASLSTAPYYRLRYRTKGQHFVGFWYVTDKYRIQEKTWPISARFEFYIESQRRPNILINVCRGVSICLLLHHHGSLDVHGDKFVSC